MKTLTLLTMLLCASINLSYAGKTKTTGPSVTNCKKGTNSLLRKNLNLSIEDRTEKKQN